MTNPRSYTTGATAALQSLCRGSCYWPSCAEPVVRFVDGKPVANLQIAHIRAANRGGPRYVPDMEDIERNAFPNLILLCHPHHTIVDRDRSDKYTIEILHQWKVEREAAGQAALAGLRNVTEDRLQELISEAISPSIKQVQDAIQRLEQFDSQAAEVLRGLINRLTDTRSSFYLDEGIVRQFYDASRNLYRLDEGIVRSLEHAASQLRASLNEDTINQLMRAAESLRRARPDY